MTGKRSYRIGAVVLLWGDQRARITLSKGHTQDVVEYCAAAERILMLDTGFGLPEFMEELGRHGFTTLLKVDAERFGFGQHPWTIVISGPALGEGNALHSDFRCFSEVLEFAFRNLKNLPGDWEWINNYSID